MNTARIKFWAKVQFTNLVNKINKTWLIFCLTNTMLTKSITNFCHPKPRPPSPHCLAPHYSRYSRLVCKGLRNQFVNHHRINSHYIWVVRQTHIQYFKNVNSWQYNFFKLDWVGIRKLAEKKLKSSNKKNSMALLNVVVIKVHRLIFPSNTMICLTI